MFFNIPKAVLFILFSIFLERYTSRGIAGEFLDNFLTFEVFIFISATLSLFFNRKLGFDPSMSTALFHTYEFFVFSLTIVGAIIADNWLGIYKTLLSMSFVYSMGALIIALGTVDPLGLPIT